MTMSQFYPPPILTRSPPYPSKAYLPVPENQGQVELALLLHYWGRRTYILMCVVFLSLSSGIVGLCHKPIHDRFFPNNLSLIFMADHS